MSEPTGNEPDAPTEREAETERANTDKTTANGRPTTDERLVDPDIPTEEAALATDGLERTFGEVVAVDDVSLRVEPGELRAVIGPNGAGKTTLFNTIMGTLAPTAGRIFLGGDDVTGDPEYRRPHRGLARSFQSNELFADQTVLENVRVVVQTTQRGDFSWDLFRESRSVGRTAAFDVLDRVGLDADPGALSRNLSHGDQRRLGIAMALATDPDVLLLDEPTSGMSPDATTATADLVESLRDDLGLTLVLIEHDMDVVLSVSDRVSVLNRGSVIATGTPEEVQNEEAVQDAYLGGMREEL